MIRRDWRAMGWSVKNPFGSVAPDRAGSDLLEPFVVAFRRGFRVRYAGHPGGGWPLEQPGQHAVDGGAFALDQRFDPAIGQIAHPAAESELVRLADGGGAKADALHAAFDEDGQGFEVVMFRQGFHTVVNRKAIGGSAETSFRSAGSEDTKGLLDH